MPEVGDGTFLHQVIHLREPVTRGCSIRVTTYVDGKPHTRICGELAEYVHLFWLRDKLARARGKCECHPHATPLCKEHAGRIAEAEHVPITREQSWPCDTALPPIQEEP